MRSSVVWGSLKARLGSNAQPKHAVAYCSQTVGPVLPPGQYKQGVEWPCIAIPPFAKLLLSVLFVGAETVDKEVAESGEGKEGLSQCVQGCEDGSHSGEQC